MLANSGQGRVRAAARGMEAGILIESGHPLARGACKIAAAEAADPQHVMRGGGLRRDSYRGLGTRGGGRQTVFRERNLRGSRCWLGMFEAKRFSFALQAQQASCSREIFRPSRLPSTVTAMESWRKKSRASSISSSMVTASIRSMISSNPKKR